MRFSIEVPGEFSSGVIADLNARAAEIDAVVAEGEMTQMGRNVVDYERLTGELPVGPAWLSWLDFRYADAEVRTDPWGSTYQLAVVSDSVWILSYGPDRTRDTNDDFQVVTVRTP